MAEGVPVVPASAPTLQGFWTPVRRLQIGIGLAITLFLIIFGWFTPLPHSVNGIAPREKLSSPSADHLFGTDQLGRDAFSRMAVATREPLRAGVIGLVVAVVVG